MITVGAMRLPQPEPLDDLDAFLRGLEPDGGYWLTMRRLADHDHSGGVMGVPVAGSGGGGDAPSYDFTSALLRGQPGPGQVSADTGDLTTASVLSVSAVDLDGQDFTGSIASLRAGDGLFFRAPDATRYARLAVTGPASDQTGWFTVPVRPDGVQGQPLASGTMATTPSRDYGAAAAAVAAHVAQADPHSVYATDADLTAHAGAADPHPTYTTATELSTAISAHAGQADPHSVYATDADVADHAAAADPHPIYVTAAEGTAAYAALTHTHPQVTTGEFHFQTNPAMTDPGTGNFRSNTGAAATATVLAMDMIGAGGTDILTLFQAMRLADTVFVQDKNDAAQWVRYQLTAGPTINAGWATVPVAVVASGGTIAGTQLCVMQLTLTAGGGGGGAGAGLPLTGGTMTGPIGVGTTNLYDLGATATRWRKLWAVDAETTNVPTIGGVSMDSRYALAAALTAALARITALEASVTALKTHTHRLGTFTGVQAPAGGIP